MALLGGPVSSAGALAPPLLWSAPVTADPGAPPDAISCPSEALCVAVDPSGGVVASSNPTASAPSWRTSATLGAPLTGVSCASAALCVAVASNGTAYTSLEPAREGTWLGTPISGHVTGVSCPSTSLCVAVDAAGEALWRSSPFGAWNSAALEGTPSLRAVSCASASLCAAVDAAGHVYVSSEPTRPGSWHERQVGYSGLSAVSCDALGVCVAFDEGGEALASADPADRERAPTWSSTQLGDVGAPAVSCAASGLCVAVNAGAGALASDTPAAGLPTWSESTAPGSHLETISCLASGFCVATDALGQALTARVPSPLVLTEGPAEVSSTTATLAGEVDSNDAAPTSCYFEYGTTSAYGSTVPCASPPATGSSVSTVTAPLTGLAPNTTYHYRLLVRTAVGGQAGQDVTFTTAVVVQFPIVYPHPSIHGVPAVGQRLTCSPGTSASSQLTYGWVRDLVAIPFAVSSTYTVKGSDSGHHLQCVVTSADPGGTATATSSFVTVPVGGAPASADETTVGTARFSGHTVTVPVSCSARATRGCNVSLRLTAVETLSGRRVVAVVAALRRATVTLASARAFLAQGSHRTVALALGTSARRLLAARHRLPARLIASGTVIGVIEATFSQQQLLLGPAAKPARVRRAQQSRARPQSARSTRRGAARPAGVGAGSPLAATPYMGWDTYFALGGRFSEASVLEQASQLLTSGLAARGFRYVWLDVGWWHGTRASNGQITVSPVQWPHGLAWLTHTLHAAGFRVGLYTDAGINGCGGANQGSYGHYEQDVNTFAAWGFDAVKVDFCGGAELQLTPAQAYASFHQAIAANSSHRPMLLSICNFLQPGQYAEGQPTLSSSAFGSYAFGPSAGNSWRTDTDVGLPGNVSFADVLRNMDADAAAPQAAGPGHWNDPDYLGPDQGLSAAQFRTQLSMWSMLAAPLMISDDLTRISRVSLSALQNSEVIAIDQDPAGVQGTLVSSAGTGEVWAKPLTGGSTAVALLNRGSTRTRIQTSAAAVGLPAAAAYTVRDVWSHRTSASSGQLATEVPPQTTVLLRVSPR